jgi:hypothetical protein
MGFSDEYLRLCWRGRSLWPKKTTCLGDWYLAGDPLELRIVADSDVDTVSFSDPAIAYVPDTDDLLELIDNQIRAGGGNPTDKSLTITYKPNTGWGLEVDYGDSTTIGAKHDSIHSLLLQLLPQLAYSSGESLGPKPGT